MKRALILINIFTLPLGVYIVYVIFTKSKFNISILSGLFVLGLVGLTLFGIEMRKTRRTKIK